MKMHIWSGTCLAIASVMAVGLAAQTPSQNPAPSSQNPSASSAKLVMVTGCVQRATPGATGTSGTAGTTGASETKFVLANGVMSAASPTGASGTPAKATTYRLDGDDAKLTAHIGHKVEISGTPDAAAAPSATSASEPKLKVEEIKMIAANCAE